MMKSARPPLTAQITLNACLSRASLSPTSEAFMPPRSSTIVGLPKVAPAAFAIMDFAAPGGPRKSTPVEPR
jgi:hypothetical protein